MFLYHMRVPGTAGGAWIGVSQKLVFPVVVYYSTGGKGLKLYVTRCNDRASARLLRRKKQQTLREGRCAVRARHSRAAATRFGKTTRAAALPVEDRVQNSHAFFLQPFAVPPFSMSIGLQMLSSMQPRGLGMA